MIVLEKLNVKYILKHLSQEEIMLKYTKVVVNRYSLEGNSFKNPFRTDKHPTCNYYYTDSGKLRFRDWSGAQRSRFADADVFDVAGIYYKLNTRKPVEFNLILHLIARDFRIHNYSNDNEYDDTESVKLESRLKDYKETSFKDNKRYKVIPRNVNRYDLQYWNTFNVDKELLKKAYIYCVEEIHKEVDGVLKRIYIYNSGNPCYAYYNGKNTDKIGIWKFYFPFAKKPKPKFMQNFPAYFGKHLYRNSEIGLITKAYKDSIAIQSYELDIDILSLVAEGTPPDKETIKDFICRHNINFILLDFDLTGIRTANKLRKLYPIIPLFLTNGRFNTTDYGSKDFTDYQKLHGIEAGKKLIEDTILYYREDLNFINNYNKQSLEWIYL